MANYPTSISSFSSKNSGDTIQGAHINDLQAEIVAIETVLVNGNFTIGSGGLTITGATALQGVVTIGTGNALWKTGIIGSDTYLYGYAGTQKFLRHSNVQNLVYSGGTSGLGFVNAADTVLLGLLSDAGLLQLTAYTAATFVAGDKYLVVDASGNVHRSALGPAS